MDSLIADGVCRDYGPTRVVSDVSLEIAPRKLTALLGGSGAGKSTLLRLFAGLEPVDAGEIYLGDNVMSRKGKTLRAEKRRIGLVFQDFALFPHLTAQQNVCFGLKHLKRGDAAHLALDWLNRLGLSERASAYPHQLSGGEQQRVAIVRALAPNPIAILMDEPFSGLDPALRTGVRKIALEAVRDAGIPALLVTHDADEALAFADHLAVMRSGVITQQGAPDHVYANPVDRQTAAALGPVNLITQESSLAPLLGSDSGVREEGIRLDPDGPVRGTILSAKHVGASMLCTIAVEGHGILVSRGHQLNVFEGDDVKLSFDPKLSFRF